MNRRRACASAALLSAVALLATACGTAGADTGAGAASASGTGASAAAGGPTAVATASGTASAAQSTAPPSAPPSAQPTSPAGTAAPAGGGSALKPCYAPAGYHQFLRLDSAEVDQGDTLLHITEVTCGVNPNNDEDVQYTPIRSESMLVHAGASITVLSGTGTPETVQESWLIDHKLLNSPYFAYRADSAHQITAMREIYHP